MKSIVLTITGAFIAAFSLVVFLLPYGFAPGGVSGIAIVINSLTKGIVPVGATVVVMNIPLFIMGYIKLGKKFIVKSIAGTILYSVVTSLGETFIKPEFFYQGKVDILTALYGGLLFGLGLGLIFRGGATTGGTDIVARVIHGKMSWLTIGQIVLIFDVVLLLLVALAYRDITVAMYSGIVVFISSKVIDMAEGGINYAKQVLIILPEWVSAEEMSSEIMQKISRGITKLEATGMHSQKSVNVLLCVIGNRQLSLLRGIVKQLVPEAFVIVSDVREIQGEWDK